MEWQESHFRNEKCRFSSLEADGMDRFLLSISMREIPVKVAEIPGPKYGNVTFDGFNVIPWDFKAHTMNTSSHQIIVNDSEATASAIKDYGQVGLILAIGKVVYNDANRRFQKWQKIEWQTT